MGQRSNFFASGLFQENVIKVNYNVPLRFALKKYEFD